MTDETTDFDALLESARAVQSELSRGYRQTQALGVRTYLDRATREVARLEAVVSKPKRRRKRRVLKSIAKDYAEVAAKNAHHEREWKGVHEGFDSTERQTLQVSSPTLWSTGRVTA